jgi:1,4-alpha-glucan branching enzyme
MIRKQTSPGNIEANARKVAVTFELPATIGAVAVAVVGEFNGWDPAAHPLAQGPDGTWRRSLELNRHQSYQFGYLVNGTTWLADWFADGYVPNRSGGFNSVVNT